jgi:hypothetical protein
LLASFPSLLYDSYIYGGFMDFMKRMGKIVVMAVLMTAAGGGALFGLGFSFGGGPILGGTWTDSQSNGTYTPYPGYTVSSFSDKTERRNLGGFAFFDMTFAELSFAYDYASGSVTHTQFKTPLGWMAQPNKDFMSQQLVFDLLGKIPFSLAGIIAFYPALGVSLRVPVGGNSQGEFAQDSNWGLGLKGGVGLDISLPFHLFIRGEALCYFELAADHKLSIPQMGGATFTAESKGYYVAPQARIAIGYKFQS